MTGDFPLRLELTAAGTAFAFRRCPPGSFLMGSPLSEPGRDPAETRRRTRLTREFWILETQATQRMWRAVMGSNPSEQVGALLPAEHVSWFDASDFAAALTEIFKFRFWRFALPTEAQWEYACRAGSTTQSSFGDVLTSAQCNCSGDYPYGTDEKGPTVGKTTPVGSYPANAWGFFDMHGNVWEWTQDVYGPYPTEPQTDPVGPEKGTRRVLRGGSWNDGAGSCRSAYRGSSVGPEGLVRRYAYNGVRLALTAK